VKKAIVTDSQLMQAIAFDAAAPPSFGPAWSVSAF
jgi:hypothetical protein